MNAVAIGQKAEASAAVTGGPLMARQSLATQMGRSLGSQSALIEDILHVGLDQREGLLYFPSPMGGIERLPADAFLGWVMAVQDMADGVWRKV